MTITRERVLRALSRFDAATVIEVVDALGAHGSKHSVWSQLQKAVANGNAQRTDDRVAKYSLTPAGKQALGK
jgi:hypothetical protein